MKNVEIIENTYIPQKSRKKEVILKKENFSLYVGDLSVKVEEKDILNIFSKMSGLLSVRICRDVISKKSLGYGYINFKDTKYAKRAMKKMNFYFDKNLFRKPLRIMWKESDKTLRNSGKGNIFINYLPIDYKTIDLYKFFLPFGKILSCKISFDEEGKSKKFGFVHFFSSRDAKEAIKKLNGSNVRGKILHLSPFIKKETRDYLLPRNLNFTNIYIKNLNLDKFTETNIRNMFEVFGEITSIMIPKEMDKPKGFAFINFASHLDAEEAVFKMDKKKVGDFILYVSRAQTKLERQNALNNVLNHKNRLTKKAKKKIFMVIKGIKGDFTLTVILFLLLSLGGFGKFNILLMIRKELSLFVNLTFEEKKKYVTVKTKKFRSIFSKFFVMILDFIKKNICEPGGCNSAKNIYYITKSGESIIKFSENTNCFKFKNTALITLLKTKAKIFNLKENLKKNWRKICYTWFSYLKKKKNLKLVDFGQYFFNKSLENLSILRKSTRLCVYLSQRIW